MRGKLVTADEPASVAKPLFDAIVMEDSESDGCLPNATGTNKSNWL
jgi:hypothetical protein